MKFSREKNTLVRVFRNICVSENYLYMIEKRRIQYVLKLLTSRRLVAPPAAVLTHEDRSTVKCVLRIAVELQHVASPVWRST